MSHSYGLHWDWPTGVENSLLALVLELASWRAELKSGVGSRKQGGTAPHMSCPRYRAVLSSPRAMRCSRVRRAPGQACKQRAFVSCHTPPLLLVRLVGLSISYIAIHLSCAAAEYRAASLRTGTRSPLFNLSAC